MCVCVCVCVALHASCCRHAGALDDIALLEMLRMGSEVASLYSDDSDNDDNIDIPVRKCVCCPL